MSMSVRFESNVENLIRRTGDSVKDAMKTIGIAWHNRAVREISVMIYNKPIPKNASGKRKWKRTNRLRSSIAFEADEVSVTVGSNVEYAAVVHEGLTNAVQQVKGHTRNVPSHTRTITQAFGKRLPTPKKVKVRAYQQTVAAHTRTVNRDANPFISKPGYELLPDVPKIILGELKE